MNPGTRPPQPRRTVASRPTAVVALGASAGGLEALGRVLEGLPAAFPAPVLVALHLDPDHRSQVVALLQHRARLAVEEARSGVPAEGGHVYVAPPDRHLELRGGRLRLTKAPRVSYSRPSIDVLFASVASDCGPGAVVAVLSGTGHDGTQGVAAIKARGGLAVAEDASTAGFPGMPEAAGRAGLLDAVLPAHQIPAFLERAVAHRVTVSDLQWRRVLGLLAARTGARFGGYRSSTLHRRLQQRIAARGCRTMAAYLRILAADASELDRLQAAFLIKVSSFNRDPAAWTALARHVRGLAAGREQGLRAWSAGCATGEEAYSIALMLAKTLGLGTRQPWKVFATDLDEGALAVARAARYGNDQVQGLSRDDLKRYFVREGDDWRVGKALRDRVVFGRHDLLHDPPLSAIDLVLCRNVLIYFAPQDKQRTLRGLATAVRPGGLLFLGRAEGLGTVPGFDRIGHTTLFRRKPLETPMASPHKRRRGTGKRVPPSAAPRRASPGRASAPPPMVSVRSRRALPEAQRSSQQELNEELQSRNEELETVNEELQSLNDELSTMEEQMRGLAEESRRTNDFLRLLLDTSSEALVACGPDNRVTFWNKAAIKRFRRSPAQAVGAERFDLVPALARPKLKAASLQARAPGRGGRIAVNADGVDYIFDSLGEGPGKRRGYLLRVRPAS